MPDEWVWLECVEGFEVQGSSFMGAKSGDMGGEEVELEEELPVRPMRAPKDPSIALWGEIKWEKMSHQLQVSPHNHAHSCVCEYVNISLQLELLSLEVITQLVMEGLSGTEEVVLYWSEKSTTCSIEHN